MSLFCSCHFQYKRPEHINMNLEFTWLQSNKVLINKRIQYEGTFCCDYLRISKVQIFYFWFDFQFIVAVVVLVLAAVNTSASVLPLAYHLPLAYSYAPHISLTHGPAVYSVPGLLPAYSAASHIAVAHQPVAIQETSA